MLRCNLVQCGVPCFLLANGRSKGQMIFTPQFAELLAGS
jgi:hypothetical protein